MSLTLRIPRRLESPNATRGGHWRVRHRLSQTWELEIGMASTVLAVTQGNLMVQTLRKFGAHEKMRVTVERHVPSGRNFIRDDDNLVYSTKPLRDALKRMGYIKDDSRKWLELPMPTQHVSEDGSDYTVITIAPVP